MVAVTKRFESGPTKSRVGAFPDVFGVTNGRFKGTESRSEPRFRFRLAAGKSGYTSACLSSREDRMVL